MKSGTPPISSLSPLISWMWSKVCSWLLTLKNRNGEITEANDATCVWMPHYHAFALIPTWKSPAFLLHLSWFMLILFAHDSFLHFPLCLCLVYEKEKKNSHSAAYIGATEEAYGSGHKGMLECQLAELMERWRDEWRTTGEALVHCTQGFFF